MAAKHRVILDTDPGVDDVLAILLALTTNPGDLELLLLSITYGNVEIENCLRNVITLFHQVSLEIAWRKERNITPNFEALEHGRPFVAAGCAQPLADSTLKADHFHGVDGLGGIHETHPQFTSLADWASLKENDQSLLFKPTSKSSPDMILQLLEENEPGTISIVAVGPLSNLAVAASKNPTVFLRAKEVICMGGNLSVPGNITPVAEFNVYADPLAAAYVFSLTSTHPTATCPPLPSTLPPPPQKVKNPLRLVLYSLDSTTRHDLHQSVMREALDPLVAAGSPLAAWVAAFAGSTFAKVERLYGHGAGLSLHDPCCVLHLRAHLPGLRLERVDVRVETGGQWSRGACVTDRRGRSLDRPPVDEPLRRITSGDSQMGELTEPEQAEDVEMDETVELGPSSISAPGDEGGWLSGKGNRIWVVRETGWEQTFAREMFRMIFNV